MDSMNPTPWYKNKWVIVLGVIVVVAVLYFLMSGSSSTQAPSGSSTQQQQQQQTVSATPNAGEIAINGKFNCLPLKTGKTPTAENCVLGIQGDDGKFYAIDTSKIQSTDPNISAQGKIHAVGTYTPASTSTEAGDLKYDGVLSVRVMQAI